jgi:hypothetical protein
MSPRQSVALSQQQLCEAVNEYVIGRKLVGLGDFEATARVKGGFFIGEVELTFSGTAVVKKKPTEDE